MTLPDVRRGEYLVICVDGREELFEERPTLAAIYQAIRCECVDTVTLDREKGIIMLVDDSGMIDGKPLNRKATAYYHEICYPKTAWGIHGDVAIANDGDFA